MDKSILYEEMQVNLGKKPNTIWTDFAESFLNETYTNDMKIYGTETIGLYEAIFGEDEAFRLYSLNENRQRDMPAASTPAGTPGWMARAKAQGGNIPAKEMEGLGAKLKSIFAGLGGSIKKYFSNGIAGVLANPLPLIAAGAGAGAIIAVVRKFKKLSDEKKKAALQALPKEQRDKALATLAKPEAELKKELEDKSKKE